MTDSIEISGGADDEVAAAIAAVVSHVIAEEAAARATPDQPPAQSPWVQAGRTPPPPTVARERDVPDWSQFTVSGDR